MEMAGKGLGVGLTRSGATLQAATNVLQDFVGASQWLAPTPRCSYEVVIL